MESTPSETPGTPPEEIPAPLVVELSEDDRQQIADIDAALAETQKLWETAWEQDQFSEKAAEYRDKIAHLEIRKMQISRGLPIHNESDGTAAAYVTGRIVQIRT